MCWSQQLFDAMIHVYNRGLTDYTTPLLELLLQLRATLKKGKPLPGVHLTSPMSMNIRKCTFTYSPSTGVVTITRNLFCTCVHVAHIPVMATICGRYLFCSEFPIMQLLFEGSTHSKKQVATVGAGC